MIKIKIKMK